MDDLKRQYDELSEEDKTILLVYKSGLSDLINNLDNDPDFEYYYEKYKSRLSDYKNSFIRFLYFKSISIETLDEFKSSIYMIKRRLDEISGMLTADKDYTLYRLVTSKEPIHRMARGNIVSTSLSVGEAFKYDSGGKIVTIFEIKIPEGAPVCYVPYRIKFNDRTNQMTISNKDDEDEIIINQALYDFEESDYGLSEGINYVSYKAHPRIKARK